MDKISADEFFNTKTSTTNTPITTPKSLQKMSANDFFSTSAKEFESLEQKRISDGSKEIINNTLNSVTQKTPEPEAPYAVDFKAAQNADKKKPKTAFETNFSGILPAASAVNTKETPLATSLKEKIPAAQFLQQTGGGPANASQIPGISQYEINKKEIAQDNAPEVVKAYANLMNYITQGNPVGQAVSRSFAGNSGATRRDSTGNKTVDKITDVINNVVTPFITPTGAPLGQGIIGSTYGATEKALSGKAGQAILKGAGKVIPGSENVVRSAVTEAAAGGMQGVGFGLQGGRDQNNQIISDALLGIAAGGVLGGVGAKLGEVIGRFRTAGIPDDEIAEIAPELLALPEAQPRTIRKQLAGEIKTTPSGDTIATPYTPQLNAATPETQAAATARQAARAYDPVELNTKYAQEVIDEYKMLKNTTTKKISNKNLYEQARQNVDARRPTDAQLTTQKLKDTRVNGESYYTGEPIIRNPQTPSREQQIMNKVNAKKPLTQEEIDFALSDQFDKTKMLPESTPTESTYVKPRTIKTEVAKVEPKVEVKPEVKTKTIVTEAKKEIKTSVTKKANPGERGFYHTLKNSGKANEAVARMNPKYEPITNETSLAGANERVKNLSKSTSDVLSRKLTTAEDGVTALRLVQEYTKMGDHETAALISGKAAEDFTQGGQLIQAASMWNRLAPEGMLLRVQREISKVNEVLGAAEEKLSLSADDAAKITQTGEKMQSAQKVRDLSQEVLEMVSNKKPGEALTADEQKLLVEFEKQVKSVNNSVKPFMKTAKQDAEKIAKIKPENRTRDQVVQYLDQKAAEALARRQKARNVGIVADLNNPVIDYSIIAAAKIARGVRTFSDLTEDMIKTVGSEYKQYADEVFAKATQRFRKENGLPTTTELERVIRSASKDFDESSKNALRRMAAEIGYYTDENLKRELTQDLQQVIKTYGRSTLGEKIAGVQTAGQLLSVPTFLRNTLGNAGQFGLEKINKVAAVPIDWTISKFTGKRTIQFIPMNQEKLWKNFVSGTSSGWREVNAMGTLDSYNVKPSVFSDKNPLKYLTKLTGASLQGMDYAAYKAAYGDVMATYAEQLGRAQGMTRKQIKANMPELLTKLDDTVRSIADQAGLYATYQDETLLSKAAQGTKKALNAASDKVFRTAVEKGVISRSLSLEGFGLGDIVLKYAKTPANLVMRGIDYSPLGFMRAIGEFIPLLKNGGKNFNQHTAVRALSRAITGTIGLTSVGYTLADAGLLTGASSSDPDKRSIEEQSGEGAYKANLSGIYRWIMSGFDKNAAKFQKGDQLIDYAWVQPAAISLGMGVNFREALNARKPGETVSNVELAKRSIIGGLRTVLENPMVTGLSNVVGGVSDLITRQDPKKLTGIVKGIPSSFVPAVLGQARNVTDNKQRVTYDKNVLKEMLNLVKNRVPGLSKQLPVSYDSLGNVRQRIQGGKENTIGQYLNSFLNPTKFTKYNVSPEAKTVLDILNDSNDKDVLPRVIQKTVKFTNEDGRQETYKLTKEEYSQMQQKTGQRVIEELQYEQDYLSDNSIDIEDRANVLKQILQDVGTEVRDEFKEAKGLVND